MGEYVDDLEPTEQEKQRALAARLLGRQPTQQDPSLLTQPQGLDRQRAVGLLGLLTGNKQLSGIGNALTENANLQQYSVPKIQAQTREEQAKATGAEQAISQQAGDVLRQAYSKIAGIDIPAGTPTGAMTSPTLEKLIQSRLPKTAVSPFSGEFYNPNAPPPKGQAGRTGALDPAARDQLAELFHQTGQLPPVGRGPSAAATIREIVNRAAEMHPETNLAGNKAAYKADTGSLSKLQTQADSIDAFENTALRNLDQFRETAKGIIDVGSPLFNAPLRTVEQKLAGDPRQAQFVAARQVAIQEVGKVLGGAVQGGAITDSQRHEVESLLGPDATLQQIEAVSQTLKQDMANRKSAIAQQLATVKGRLGGGQIQEAAPQVVQNQPPPGVRRFTRVNGKLVEVK